MEPPKPYCLFCTHYRGARSEDPDARPGCDAFPEGIPRRILESSVDHREPYPDDGGIRFEKHPKAPPLADEEFGVPYSELA